MPLMKSFGYSAMNTTRRASLYARTPPACKSNRRRQGAPDRLLHSYVGPLTAELASVREQQAEINRFVATAERTAENHERFTEPGYANMDGSECSKEDKASKAAAARNCRQSAETRRQDLVPLVAREAEILELMREP